MALSNNYNYQTRLFFLIIVFTWILTFSFFTIQYTREREYKFENLNDKLQLINMQIINNIKSGNPITPVITEHILLPDSLRITIMDFNGKVRYDNRNKKIIENHKNRKEFRDAMINNSGYTVRRQSENDKYEFFYSATRGDSIIVRTALPYTTSLSEALRVDTVYIWVILFIAICLSIIAFFATRRIGQSIRYLKDFAKEAESGEVTVSSTKSLPNDELGEISAHIVNMYTNLEKITKERDASLKNILFEEKEKARIKHQLTNNINHELKTPVHAIRACLETIIDNKEKLDMQQTMKLIENSYQNILRLSDLMHDIATITNMTDASNQIEKADVFVNSILRTIKEEVSLLPIEKQMRINIVMPTDVIVHGNNNLIEAIFRNLINNSLVYSGGRDIYIELSGEDSNFYKFKVWDNGIGIAEEHITRLFERFYRIDDGRSRKLGGTGLGLSIVKNAVIFHGGEISVSNRYNDGLEFTFTLHK